MEGRASSTVFHQRHVGGRAVYSGDTEPAGAGGATEFGAGPDPVFSCSPGIDERAGGWRAWGIEAVRTSWRVARRCVWI